MSLLSSKFVIRERLRDYDARKPIEAGIRSCGYRSEIRTLDSVQDASSTPDETNQQMALEHQPTNACCSRSDPIIAARLDAPVGGGSPAHVVAGRHAAVPLPAPAPRAAKLEIGWSEAPRRVPSTRFRCWSRHRRFEPRDGRGIE
jgi:hypothetical protein